MIHPTAIIHPQARVHGTVRVGPYAVIDEGVEVGPHCLIGPHVHLTGLVTIGEHNEIHTGCVIGDAPQDLKYKGDPTGVRIGARNVFREHVTVNRSNKPTEDTIIGSDNFLMAHCHVAHNCRLADQVIMANGALLAGHVTVGDAAFISGNCVVHQFVRIGTRALMQGGSAISMDLPPYTVACGANGMCGLNVVGLRRAGLTAGERTELRQIYRALFRSGQNLRAALAESQKNYSSPAAQVLLEFIATTRRGIVSDVGGGTSEDSRE
jgi:UDP-N-acetylglucosamine acyltransferase